MESQIPLDFYIISRKLLPLLSLNEAVFEFLQHTSLEEIQFPETF